MAETAKCLYPYCINPEDGEIYFRVPAEPGLRSRWLSSIPQVLGLTKEAVTAEGAFLCSKHFEKSNFDIDDNGRLKGMINNAIPSIFYVPSKSISVPAEDQDALAAEGLEEMRDTVVPAPPPISLSTSDETLYFKVRQEELKLLIIKEKVKGEEEEYSKVRDELEKIEKSNKTEEIQEAYLNVLKRMRPIAPKDTQKKKPKTLEEIIVYMRKERLMSDEASVVLLNLFADVPLDDYKSAALKEGLHCFAQYMTFYNTQVYENLGSTFDAALPQVSSVRQLFNPVSGEPGWSQHAFDCVRKEALKVQSNGKKLLCSLLVGSMNIKSKEEWDGKKIRGYVDCGPASFVGFDMDSDGLPTARSALVLMLVPLDPQQLWRVPVAYFYVNVLTSTERANLIREAVLRLHSVGAIVLSVTCDVFSSDKCFLDSLGVSFDVVPQISSYFVNPADPLLRVHLIFDECSLLSSVQNMWVSSQRFTDGDGRSICWKFVSELIKLQETQAATFTQTFDSPHWSWDSVYNRNRLMAQLFSETTANAMEFCWNVLKLDQFFGCEGTVTFIQVMSKIRRLLCNRRYLRSEDEASLRADYHECLDYLYNMRSLKEEPLHSGSSGSFRFLYQTLLSGQEILRQVPEFSSHCVSLDEVEMLCYAIMTYTDWSSKPTARQFTSAFTNHVEKNGYSSSWSCVQINSHWWIDSSDVSMARKGGCLVPKPEFASISLPTNCSTRISFECPSAEFKSFSVDNFIAVSVVKSLANVLLCEPCIEALQDAPSSDNPLLRLLRITCGAILCPSLDVFRICAYSEHHLQVELRTSSVDLKREVFEWKNKIISTIANAVLRDIQEKGKKMFPCMHRHFLECSPEASHLYRLIRGVSCCYTQIRLRNIRSWCPI